jgi:hypothetical protein
VEVLLGRLVLLSVGTERRGRHRKSHVVSFPGTTRGRSFTGSFNAIDGQRHARRLRRVSFGARVDRRARPPARPRRRDARGP